MRILGKAKTDVQNIDRRQNKGQRIATIVQEHARTRVKYDLADWTLALQNAESIFNPSRRLLYDIFDNVIIDAHLSSLMDRVRKKVNGRNLIVKNEDGTEDEEATKIFQASWVQDFIDLTVDAKFYGFSLIQLGTLVNDKFESVELVPRKHVKPEKKLVTANEFNVKGANFDDPKFSRWLVPVGDPKDLGLLMKATPQVLWKMRAMASWSVFAEIFGMPLRIGKTTSSDTEAKNKMAQMLKNMGSNTWGVFDEDEIIEMVQTNRSDAYQVYQELIKTTNGELSKLILGQTMTSEDGSSLSQASVHKEVEDEILLSYLKFVENTINDKLIPKMVGLGMTNLSGKIVHFDLSDDLNVLEMFDIDKELLKHYKIPVEYIREKYGTEVEEKEAPQPGIDFGGNVPRETSGGNGNEE